MSQNQSNEVLLEQLQTSLEIYHKCLTFDFVAILLNETLDEPSQTNLPSAWVKDVENTQTIEVLFFLAKVILQKLPFDQN